MGSAIKRLPDQFRPAGRQVTGAVATVEPSAGLSEASPATIPRMKTARLRPVEAPNIVDLFAGPGGLDVGAAWLGIPTLGIELDENACATRLSAGLATKRGDVRAFSPVDFPNANVLTGGPPCQTFTVAGSGSGRRALGEVIKLISQMASSSEATSNPYAFEDDRTGLVLEPMRWALEALRADKPYEAIVLEQVPAVLPIWEAFHTALEKFGYGVAHGIVRTEEYGVPQTRRRAVLIARLNEPNVSLPAPTHQAYRKGKQPDPSATRRPWVSMADALNRETPYTIVSNYGSGGDPRQRGRRTSSEPSATITGKVTRNRLELPEGDWTRLTFQEAGQLQTFPGDYPWSGKDIGQQIGNAIPPRLAVHILASVLGIDADSIALDRLATASWRSFKGGGLSRTDGSTKRTCAPSTDFSVQ